MRNLILLLLIPFIGFTQDYSEAVEFQNTVRTYYNLKPYVISATLNKIAKLKAEYLAKIDKLETSVDPFGETIFRIEKPTMVKDKDYYLDASIGWVLNLAWTKNQVLCSICSEVGYGWAENETNVYIVAKYDKMYIDRKYDWK